MTKEQQLQQCRYVTATSRNSLTSRIMFDQMSRHCVVQTGMQTVLSQWVCPLLSWYELVASALKFLCWDFCCCSDWARCLLLLLLHCPASILLSHQFLISFQEITSLCVPVLRGSRHLGASFYLKGRYVTHAKFSSPSLALWILSRAIQRENDWVRMSVAEALWVVPAAYVPAAARF